jgi:hypothetical protein
MYCASARYADAEPLLNAARGILEKLPGDDLPGLPIVLTQLAELYEKTDREDEATHLRRQAAARERSTHHSQPPG